MDEIPGDYVGKAIDEIVGVIGIKENVNYRVLVAQVRSKRIEECIENIARYLALPIKVKLEYVPDGYRPDATDGFKSSNVVKTEKDRRGHQGIAAQVSIPVNLPFYGSNSLVNLPIQVRITQSYVHYPETLICVMAHELSHIVLRAIGHEQWDNEIFTDLTAMILGFSEVTRIGRKTERFSVGYLSDEIFALAHKKIAEILSEKSALKKEAIAGIGRLRQKENESKKMTKRFKRYLEFVDQHPNQKFSRNDAATISALHHSGHLDAYSAILSSNQNLCERIEKRLSKVIAYTGSNTEFIVQSGRELEAAANKLEEHYQSLLKQAKTLRKYVAFWFQIKTAFSMPSADT
jgi:ribosomal protein S16